VGRRLVLLGRRKGVEEEDVKSLDIQIIDTGFQLSV
jgi:hypothetical protein